MVVVLERDLAHVDRVLLHQRCEHVLAVGQDRLLGQQLDTVRARALGERVVAVRQDQDVLRVRVLEEVEDALLLHEPRHEVQVRLAVLHAELALGIAALAPDLEVRVALRREHGLQDLQHAHVLVDLAVAREREEPQPRHHLGAVAREVHRALAAREAADQAVDGPLRSVRQLDRQRDRRPQQVRGLDRVIRGEQVDVEGEGRGHAFHTGVAGHQEPVRPQRRLHPQWPFRERIWHVRRPGPSSIRRTGAAATPAAPRPAPRPVPPRT